MSDRVDAPREITVYVCERCGDRSLHDSGHFHITNAEATVGDPDRISVDARLPVVYVLPGAEPERSSPRGVFPEPVSSTVVRDCREGPGVVDPDLQIVPSVSKGLELGAVNLRDKQGQAFDAWFTVYPKTHAKRNHTVEVVTRESAEAAVHAAAADRFITGEKCVRCGGGATGWRECRACAEPAVPAGVAGDRPGSHAAIAAGLDAYHARNLLEALKLAADTGDWHGSLRIACGIVLDREGDKYPAPNVPAHKQAGAAEALAVALERIASEEVVMPSRVKNLARGALAQFQAGKGEQG